MTYHKLFNEDKGYTEMIGKFYDTKKVIEKGIAKKMLDGTTVAELSNKAFNELQEGIKAFNVRKKQEIEAEAKAIEDSYKQQLDYTSDNAKNIEKSFKVMTKYELENYVTDLNSTDMLELNLLRLELRERGLEKEEDAVHRYQVVNKIESGYTEDPRYDELSKAVGTLYTMGQDKIVVVDKLIPLDILAKDTRSDFYKAADAAKNTSVNLEDVSRSINAIESYKKELASIQ